MATDHIVDFSKQQPDYSHKKFHGNCLYAHKKFGTRVKQQICQINDKKNTQQNTSTQEEEAKTKGNKIQTLFRPYALGNNTPRKRKYQDLTLKDQLELSLKGVPAEKASVLSTSMSTLSMTSPLPVMYAANQQQQSQCHNLSQYLMQQSFPPMRNYHRHIMPPMKRHYQFSSQTFALILQKQRAALCMGEILKRQHQANQYNLIGK